MKIPCFSPVRRRVAAVSGICGFIAAALLLPAQQPASGPDTRPKTGQTPVPAAAKTKPPQSAGPSGAAAAEAAKWRDYTRAYTREEANNYVDTNGVPLPPGDPLEREEVETLSDADRSKIWKLKDGTTTELKAASWTLTPHLEKTNFRLYLTYTKDGNGTGYFPVSRLHPEEFPRVQRLMWYRRFKNLRLIEQIKKEEAQRPPDKKNKPAEGPPGTTPAPAIAREEGPAAWLRFSGSGLPKKETQGHANRPPGPEVAAMHVTTAPVWPQEETWRRRNGQQVTFALYGWSWGTDPIDPAVQLQVLYPETANLAMLPALDLEPSEYSRLLQALWRRHYGEQERRTLPRSSSRYQGREDCPEALLEPFVHGTTIALPSLPLPGCRHLPPPAVPPRRDTMPLLKDNVLNLRSGFFDFVILYMLWWDETGWLPLNRKEPLDRRATWLIRQVEKDFDSRGNTYENMRSLPPALQKFSTSKLDGRYDFQLFADTDYRMENLARLTTGMNGVMIRLMAYTGGARTFNVFVPLVEAAPDGSATVLAWGKLMSGKFEISKDIRKKGDSPKKGEKELPVYEFVFADRSLLPDHLSGKAFRYTLGSDDHELVRILVPQKRIDPAAPPGKHR